MRIHSCSLFVALSSCSFVCRSSSFTAVTKLQKSPPHMSSTTKTTSDEDRLGVEQLRATLDAQNRIILSPTTPETPTNINIAQVQIDEGANKYVLVAAQLSPSSPKCHFIKSLLNADYHKDAAAPLLHDLRAHTNVDVLGGGRIDLSTSKKYIKLYGFSYGFGPCDHSIGASLISKDPRYEGFTVETSDEGY